MLIPGDCTRYLRESNGNLEPEKCAFAGTGRVGGGAASTISIMPGWEGRIKAVKRNNPLQTK